LASKSGKPIKRYANGKFLFWALNPFIWPVPGTGISALSSTACREKNNGTLDLGRRRVEQGRDETGDIWGSRVALLPRNGLQKMNDFRVQRTISYL